MTATIPERFRCSRCGYERPLADTEDGFRLYRLHEQRCCPGPGEQLWLPCINEDAPNVLAVTARESTGLDVASRKRSGRADAHTASLESLKAA